MRRLPHERAALGQLPHERSQPLKVIHRTDIPKRTDLGELRHHREHKHALFGKQEGVCNGCKISFPFQNMTVDHIIPKSKGGADHPENLQLLCGSCNSIKGTSSHEEMLVRLKAAGILK